MLQVYSDIVQFQGDHYDFGYMQGELLKNSPILPNRKKQWFSKKKHHFIIDENEFRQVILTFAPGIWDEIHGLADALEMQMKEAVREFGGYYLEYGRSGCTIFTGTDYMNITDSHKAFRMMNDPDKGVFSTKYGAWSGTLHTSMYYPKQLKVGFTLGGDRMPLIFDLNKWLHGEKFRAKRIKGELDTDIPFVQMVEL